MTYIVYINGILDNIFDTFEDAENHISEILAKYPFINPDHIHITCE